MSVGNQDLGIGSSFLTEVKEMTIKDNARAASRMNLNMQLNSQSPPMRGMSDMSPSPGLNSPNNNN